MAEPTDDITADITALNRLFVKALLALEKAGEEEEACTLAASGWSALRHSHAREAEKLGGLLHALTHTRHHSSPNSSLKGGNHARE
jgi:hypothetical protein